MIVDAIIVGRGVGVKALAAVGATDWTYWLILWVIQALTQGFATRISHHFGEKNIAKLRKSITMSVFLCVGIGILLTVLALLLYCLTIIRKIDFIKTQRNDWQWDSRIVYELCAMGLPLALQHVLIAIGGMILQSTINSQGFVFVAGFTATNKIYGLLESSAFALNYATTTYISQNYGARLYDRTLHFNSTGRTDKRKKHCTKKWL